MYSFVIKIGADVNQAVEEVRTIPTLGFTKNIAEVDIADPNPNNISVIINNTFFLFKFFFHSVIILINFRRVL